MQLFIIHFLILPIKKFKKQKLKIIFFNFLNKCNRYNIYCVSYYKGNGKGWELTDKDNIVISFDKYKSDITVSQDLIIGYVKDGIMYEGEVFDELSGKYSFSPDEKGEYFFYLLSGSSDYLSLKSGNLEVN